MPPSLSMSIDTRGSGHSITVPQSFTSAIRAPTVFSALYVVLPKGVDASAVDMWYVNIITFIVEK